ncbi:prefoldin subunit 5 [Paenibacillus sp. V4I9]|uniref:hypothetical protein n=1 Tax=Paenibacillus sp. V4I9 TaxID=3042308 RepID=UPI0027853B0E|nr:hypothetical protein [Paenibacillus sp. V4I9]MDQ0885060.1 prefoldin subunit 5 [Paenibacillus sp. V4I9]
MSILITLEKEGAGVQKSMAILADELQALRSNAEYLRDIYGKAAAATDLTFIKIIEEQYEILTEEFNNLADAVSKVQANLDGISDYGGDQDGR